MHTSSFDAVPIRLRLAIGYVAFVIVTVAVVGAFSMVILENNLRREVDDGLHRRASQILRQITPDDSRRLDRGRVSGALSDLVPQDEFSDPGIFVQVRDQQGTMLASSPPLSDSAFSATQSLVAQAVSGQENYATLSVGLYRVRVLAEPVVSAGQVVGVVLVGESLHPLDVTLRQIQQLLVAAGAGIALLALAGGWLLTGRALGPVVAVTRVARRIATTGQFDQRIPASVAKDELGELTATFNDMLARLEVTFRRQREFLADASHELRGPLTVIRGNLDLLKLDLPDAERQDCVREATAEVSRMSRLVSDLLFLAEVDAQETVSHEKVELNDVVRAVWQRATSVDAGAHQVVVAQNDPVTVIGDPGRLHQLVWNLIENALRYTPAGGKIMLSVRNHGSVAEVIVSDTGIGIAPEHVPRIFERFYRVDRARSRTNGSSGLGLAIVKQVAEAHGGQVRIRSELGEGTIFSVVLPTVNSASLVGASAS
jgi:two-component system OmpR family sensor kinase